MPLQISGFIQSSRNRRLASTAIVASIATLATACGGGSSTGSQQLSAATSNVEATATTVPGGTVLRVADQLGYLHTLLSVSGEDKDFPYQIKYSNFVGGPPMLQAFQAGSLDAGYVADTPLIFAQAAHQSVVGIEAWAAQHGTAAVVTAPGTKLSGWASLKGKKVAYQQGTVEEAVLLQGLHSVGLSLKDITTVNLATTSITPALSNHSVDAGVLVQPLIASYFASNPTASTVVKDNTLTDRTSFLIADTSAISDTAKRAALADYSSRIAKAVHWVSTHPTQWARALYVNQYKVPLATATKIVTAAGHWSTFALPGPLAGPQQTLANLYTAAGDIPSTVSANGEFSTSFNTVVADAAKAAQ